MGNIFRRFLRGSVPNGSDLIVKCWETCFAGLLGQMCRAEINDYGLNSEPDGLTDKAFSVAIGGP